MTDTVVFLSVDPYSLKNSQLQSMQSTCGGLLSKQDELDSRREVRRRDKADRATVEHALDPRTRIVLFKLLSRGAISQIDGCVSTGSRTLI